MIFKLFIYILLYCFIILDSNNIYSNNIAESDINNIIGISFYNNELDVSFNNNEIFDNSKISWFTKPDRLVIDLMRQPDDLKLIIKSLPNFVKIRHNKYKDYYRIVLDFVKYPQIIKLKNITKNDNAKIAAIDIISNQYAIKYENLILDKNIINQQNKIMILYSPYYHNNNVVIIDNKNDVANFNKEYEKNLKINNVKNKINKYNSIKQSDSDFIVLKNTLNYNKNDKKLFIQKDKKNFVIVIDAGHGGYDPGTIGAKKIPEKDITLMYARLLKNKLDSFGIKTHMIRNSDIFIPLAERVPQARRHNADLFISLHADSAPSLEANGVTIYTIPNISDINKKDEISNNDFFKKEYLPKYLTKKYQNSVVDFIFNLTHGNTKNKSSIIAEDIILNLEKQKLCNSCRTKEEGFAVLKGIDIPSILIELGYLTNQNDENKIVTRQYAEKMTNIIALSVLKVLNS